MRMMDIGFTMFFILRSRRVSVGLQSCGSFCGTRRSLLTGHPPEVDEVEDGGRARVVEEGIAFAALYVRGRP